MDATVTGRKLWGIATGLGLLNILVHLPFLFRYDLYFQSDIAVCHLMAKQIMRGEFSIYNWGADYGGIGPVDFTTALLFKIFGASIPLSGFVSLLFWAAGITLLTAYVGRHFGRPQMIAAGAALAVGMPHFLMYCTQPLSSTYPQAMIYIGAFLWLTVTMVRRGVSSKLPVFVGLLMGWFWYAHKQVLVIWFAIGVTLLITEEGRAYLRQFVRSKMVIFFGIAFLIGYSPELLYKLGCFSHEDRVPDNQRLMKFATPEVMAQNWYMVFRCLLTYVNADPWSRNHSSVHYLNHMENWESFPAGALDTVGIMAACLIIGFLLMMAGKSYREKNLPVLLLAVIPLADVLIIVLSGMAGGAYYGIRRYLMPAGIVGLMWLGVRLVEDWSTRRRVRSAILGLTVAGSLYSQWQMLDIPDQLADYKQVSAEIEKAGYKYGLSWFSYSHILTALTDEGVSFGIIDRRWQCPYQKPALEQEVVAVVWPAITPPPFEFAQKLFFGGVRIPASGPRMLPDEITVFDRQYRRIGEQRLVGELGWAPYRKQGGGLGFSRPAPNGETSSASPR